MVRETWFEGKISEEAWGLTEFEYYYSRPLAQVKEYREKSLFMKDKEKIEKMFGNVTEIHEDESSEQLYKAY